MPLTLRANKAPAAAHCCKLLLLLLLQLLLLLAELVLLQYANCRVESVVC
jgi:hypothetical protein